MSLPDAVDERASISLAELDSSAALLSRVDRKYFVPEDLLSRLLRMLPSDWRVLTIDGCRAFRYRTVYFDSPGFEFYRQHVQRRRHRFKVRTRLYCDSGDCLLEVKSKGLRDRTLKQRIAHDPDRRAVIDAPGRSFATAITGMDAAQLAPVLETIYRRTTLSDGIDRITLDRDLAWTADTPTGVREAGGPRDVLVETKSDTSAGALDRMLLRAGIRPHSVSKYCLGASLLYPQLPGNDWARIRRRYWPQARPDGRPELS